MGAPQTQAPDVNPHARVHVLQVLEATAGGTRRHLRDLVCGLDAQRYRLSVAVSGRRDPDFARDLALFRARGIGVHGIGMWRRPAPLGDAWAGLRLLNLCRRLRPDVVHAHSSKAGFLGRAAARAAGVSATVYTPHAFSCDMTVGAAAQRVFRALERLALPWTDRLIAVSAHERDLALELGYSPSRVALIPNGVPAGGNRSAAMKEAGGWRGKGCPVAGFVGRLCAQKAPEVFAQAVPRILADLPEARFLMVVDQGPSREQILRRMNLYPWRDRIDWGEAHDETGVAACLARMDVLLMPSRWEGLPYTLLEAMDAGVPVVASRAGGIPDVLTDGVDGLLVPVGDAGALAAGGVRLLRDPVLRARLACAARQRVGDFGLDAMLTRTAAVYDGVLSGKRGRGG